jgi:hypothetical protein
VLNTQWTAQSFPQADLVTASSAATSALVGGVKYDSDGDVRCGGRSCWARGDADDQVELGGKRDVLLVSRVDSIGSYSQKYGWSSTRSWNSAATWWITR